VSIGRASSTLAIYGVYAMAARTWERDVCGIFNTVWLLSNAFVPIFLLGIPTATLYFYPKRENSKALAFQAGTLLLVSAIFMVTFVFWGSTQVLYELDLLKKNSHLFDGFLIAFLPYLFVQVAGGVIDSMLIARGCARTQAMLAMFGSVGLCSISLWGWWFHASPTYVLALMSVIGVLRVLLGYAILWSELENEDVIEFKGIKQFVLYTRSIALNDTLGAISRSVDRFVVLALLGTTVFADYHFGAIEMPIALLLSAIASVLVPEFSRLFTAGNLQEIRLLWKNVVSGMSVLVLPLCCFLLAFCDIIISIYLPRQYVSSTWVFGVFLLMLPLRCAIFNPLLVGIGKASWAFGGSLLDLVLNLCLSFSFVKLLLLYFPEWAFIGPAFATVIATYTQVFFLLFVISRHLHWKVTEVLPWKSIFRRFGLAVVAASVSRMICDFLPNLIPILSLSAGLVSFVLMLVVITYFSSRDRHELKILLHSLRIGGRRIDR